MKTNKIKYSIVEVVDDKKRTFKMKKINMNYGETTSYEVLVYDPHNMFDEFLKSPFYTFMNWAGNAPTRTTSKRINEIHRSWFEPADKGTLSSWFFSEKGNTLGACALYDNEQRFWDDHIDIAKPAFPILMLLSKTSIN